MQSGDSLKQRAATPELHTKRLLLRAWRDADRDPFAELNADSRVTEFLDRPLARPESDALVERLRAHFDQYGFGMWALEAPTVAPFIGFVGLHVPTFTAPFMLRSSGWPEKTCVEIAWRLGVPYWGNGYASEGARAALAFAFERLALREVFAWTVPANERSRWVMTAIGFEHSPADDFDHPKLPEGHPLRRHVLYRLARERWVGR